MPVCDSHTSTGLPGWNIYKKVSDAAVVHSHFKDSFVNPCSLIDCY
jgi:hypothetical protein